MEPSIIKIPPYKVQVNSKGEEWVQTGHLVFKLNRISDGVRISIIDEEDKRYYGFTLGREIIGNIDEIKSRLEEYVQVSENQVKIIFDCISHCRLVGTLSNEHHRDTEKGTKYIDIGKCLMSACRQDNLVYIRFIGATVAYDVTLTTEEFDALLNIVKDK